MSGWRTSYTLPTALLDFLAARITEDEGWFSEHYYFGYMEATPRLLADCAAKRQRIDSIRASWIGYNDDGILGDFLALEALPYASHPEYREEWR